MGHWGMGMGGWAWLFLALLIIGIVVLVVVLVRVLAGGTAGGPATPAGGGRPDRHRAQEILAERYARGEISTEEYQERLRVLEGG
jgi:putative membrane protein